MENFIPYELAVKLKEKGFPQRPDYCNYSSYYEWDGLRKIHSLSNASVWFDPNISRDNIYFAPTISQVLKWLREEKRWVIVVRLYSTNGWYWFIQDEKGELKSSYLASCNDCFPTYELAALAGVEYCLDNLV